MHIVERPWSGKTSYSFRDCSYPAVFGVASVTHLPLTDSCAGYSFRPKRRMPTMTQIAKHHGFDRSTPLCIRCGLVPDDYATWKDAGGLGLERAHVIDRVFDGLDTLANLLPLCWRCHRGQPIFKAGDEAAALDWFIGEPTIHQYRSGETQAS